MNIGWMTWEPGLLGDMKTSAGGSYWNRAYINHRISKGDRVHYMLSGKQPYGCERIPIADLDVIVCTWRWHLGDDPKYVERNLLHSLQNALLNLAYVLKIPVIIRDQDHKMTPDEISTADKAGFILTEPSLNPRKYFRKMLFPAPTTSFRPFSLKRYWRLAYVGNNYERYEQAKKFLGAHQTWYGYQTTIFGNWLEESSSRESGSQVLSEFLHVDFPGRLSKNLVVPTLATSYATINLAKDSYNEAGLIPVRWWEAAAAHCPMFIPAEFNLTGAEMYFTGSQAIVKDDVQLADRMMGWMYDGRQWLQEIDRLRTFVFENMTYDTIDDVIEEVT